MFGQHILYCDNIKLAQEMLRVNCCFFESCHSLLQRNDAYDVVPGCVSIIYHLYDGK